MKLLSLPLVAALSLAATGCSALGIITGGGVLPNNGVGTSSARPVGYIYTTLYGKNAIMEINNTQSRANPDPILVPNGPRSMAVDPRSIQQYLYVVCELADTVAVVDRRSRTVIRSIGVGRRPYGIAISPDGSRAFVTNSDDDTVSVIDTSSNTVLQTVQLNAFSTTTPQTSTTTGQTTGGNVTQVKLEPKGIAVNALGTQVYVACAGGYMVELDGAPPQYNAAGQLVTQAQAYSGHRNVPLTGAVQPMNIAVASTIAQAGTTSATTGTTGTGTTGTTSDSVFISDPQGNRLFSIAANQASATALTGSGQPWGLGIGHDAKGNPDKLYVTQSSANNVAVFDLPALSQNSTGSIEGHNPQAISVSPDGQDLYISVTGDNSVAVMHRTSTGGITRPEYFNLTSLNQEFVTSTGELALAGYL